MGGLVVQPYVVIINANNRTSSLDGDVVAIAKDLYLKNTTEWPNGEPATPYARPADNPTDKAFVQLILGMRAFQLDGHWKNLAQYKGLERPEVVADAKELVRIIAKDKGALGVIVEAAVPKLPAKVRILFRFTPEPVVQEKGQSAKRVYHTVDDFVVENVDHVSERLTAFNHASNESGLQQGSVGEISGYQVLVSYSSLVLLRLAYSWDNGGQSQERIDDFLVSITNQGLEIAERIENETALELKSLTN